MNFIKRSFLIRQDQDKWLDKEKPQQASELVRELLDAAINANK